LDQATTGAGNWLSGLIGVDRVGRGPTSSSSGAPLAQNVENPVARSSFSTNRRAAGPNVENVSIAGGFSTHRLRADTTQ
jgi:hypothetical protein